MEFEQKFTVHPVGQGLFYTGVIKYNKVDFRMVFDCGTFTSKAGEREVSEFTNSELQNNAPIDLLVISHFDGDHINKLKLLLKDRKVKKLVAPFIDFKEKITLALRFASEYYSDQDSNSDFVIDCIVDVLTALGDHLDGDSEIILIDYNPDKSPDVDDNPNSENQSSNLTEEVGIEFEIDGKSGKISDKDLKSTGLNGKGLKIFKVLDNNTGRIRFTSQLKIMDLFFYTKKIGKAEEKFFSNVFKEFIKYNIAYFKDSQKPTYDEITSVIKRMKGGTTIKEIFGNSYIGLDLSETKTNIKNLNTTALCMLHRNRLSFYELMYKSRKNQHEGYFIKGEENIIQISNTGNKIISKNFHDRWSYIYDVNDPIFYHNEYLTNRYPFPNVLLTSDIFLKRQTEVDAFYKHYLRCWHEFSLFQIPHHGSKYNSDKKLFGALPYGISNFINYGIKHSFISRWSHPSSEVIVDLIATNQYKRYYGVHENFGIQYVLRINLPV